MNCLGPPCKNALAGRSETIETPDMAASWPDSSHIKDIGAVFRQRRPNGRVIRKRRRLKQKGMEGFRLPTIRANRSIKFPSLHSITSRRARGESPPSSVERPDDDKWPPANREIGA